METLAPLNADNARSALAAACAAVGLDPTDAELIRLGSNAVFRLRSQPVVARVRRDARDLDAIARELAVSRWLATEGVPAVRALDVAQPVLAESRAVTFWVSVSDTVEYGDTRELAAILRHLHTLSEPIDITLPHFDPVTRLKARIGDTTAFRPADLDMLSRRADALAEEFSSLHLALPAGPIHGDANVGNLLRSSAGQAVLSDLDDFSIGPREWDLTLTAMYFERYEWHTESEYRAFCATYGFDVMRWPGYRILADLKELMMVTWLAQNAEDEASKAELCRRLWTLRRGTSRTTWRPF